MLGALPEQHRQADAGGLGEGKQRKLQRLDQAARRIRTFVERHQERTGAGGEPVKSNVTDNEHGNIKGPHGVIQGYDGLAVADSKNQIIPVLREVKKGLSKAVILPIQKQEGTMFKPHSKYRATLSNAERQSLLQLV
ncbi:MAG: hypothetical protein LBD18_05520, partial [Treponema sp.]|nr:hypothetical protein [Treponema sp.]